jgi:hypothetical protein
MILSNTILGEEHGLISGSLAHSEKEPEVASGSLAHSENSKELSSSGLALNAIGLSPIAFSEWRKIHEIPCMKISSISNNSLCGTSNYFYFLIKNMDDESQPIKFSVRYYTYNTKTNRSQLINKQLKKYYSTQKSSEIIHYMKGWECKMIIRQRLGYEVKSNIGAKYYRGDKSYIGHKRKFVSNTTLQDVCIGEQKEGFYIIFFVKGNVPKLSQSGPTIYVTHKLLKNAIFEGVTNIVSLNYNTKPIKKIIEVNPKRHNRKYLYRRTKRRKINYKDSDKTSDSDKSSDNDKSSDGDKRDKLVILVPSEKSADGSSEGSWLLNSKPCLDDPTVIKELYQDRSWLDIGKIEDEIEKFLVTM